MEFVYFLARIEGAQRLTLDTENILDNTDLFEEDGHHVEDHVKLCSVNPSPGSAGDKAEGMPTRLQHACSVSRDSTQRKLEEDLDIGHGRRRPRW